MVIYSHSRCWNGIYYTPNNNISHVQDENVVASAGVGGGAGSGDVGGGVVVVVVSVVVSVVVAGVVVSVVVTDGVGLDRCTGKFGFIPCTRLCCTFNRLFPI